MNSTNRATLASIKGWTFPQIHFGKSSYVSFSAYDPVSGRLKRKKIMLNHLGRRPAMRAYGELLVKRLTAKLLEGWNPWVEAPTPLEYTRLEDACERYREYVVKQLSSGDMREQTTKSYLSFLHVFWDWSVSRNLVYTYQLDRRSVADFLDYVYVERNNTFQTRNNYAGWLKTFCRYMLDRGFLASDPTQFIKQSRRYQQKNRDVLPDEALVRVRGYLEERNRHFLLACYLIYYCFIRPHEMSLLRIQDISLKGQTVFVGGEVAKNHRDAAVTLPAKVARLMIDLRVFDAPGSFYLFSDDFCPGREARSEKAFRDYWTRNVRKDLNLGPRYKFYSLKDTGITNMLKAKKNILSVRDQARHSDISITNIYTPRGGVKGDVELMDYDGVF